MASLKATMFLVFGVMVLSDPALDQVFKQADLETHFVVGRCRLCGGEYRVEAIYAVEKPTGRGRRIM